MKNAWVISNGRGKLSQRLMTYKTALRTARKLKATRNTKDWYLVLFGLVPKTLKLY